MEELYSISISYFSKYRLADILFIRTSHRVKTETGNHGDNRMKQVIKDSVRIDRPILIYIVIKKIWEFIRRIKI
jgi:hypothetical protein